MSYLEFFLLSYLPLLLIANLGLHVVTWRRQNRLIEKLNSLAKKINQGMAGLLELDANEGN